MQYYHSNATTNVVIRREIAKNFSLSAKKLSERYHISVPTVMKWKNRECPNDRSSRPKNIKYSLSPELENLAVCIRKNSWFSLTEIHEMLQNENEKISKSSVYRAFVRHNINQIPKEKREKAKQFKAYEPGFLHIDVTYLPKINGVKHYLFVAIDRATRLLFYRIYDKKTAKNAQDFLEKCRAFFPFEISHILTDNGLEFTNRLLKSKKGDLCEKVSQFEEKCREYGIKHKLTRPCTPKTNGMVERVNGIIKQATILRYQFDNMESMNRELDKFLIYYNTMRRHGGLVKELGVKVPIEAVRKWANINPNIFKEKFLQNQNLNLFLNRKR